MSQAAARAELLADGAAAASGAEFFRGRPFLEAEAAVSDGELMTLRIESAAGALTGPVLVRTIGEGPERDAVSPYGYPGLSGPRGLLVDPAETDFSATGLVSLFLRHTLGEPPLAGASVRNVVQIADPALPPKSRPSDRRQVRRNLEAGYRLRVVPGAETTVEQRAGFLVAYEETMVRTAAAPRYFFGAAYFDRLLEAERTWLAIATAPSGEIAAASLAVVSDGFLHYYLSGSADSHLRDSPMKNIVAALAEHAAGLGLPLNLGGGLSRGDALEEFKRGFANREQEWHTSEIVCDQAAYDRLSGSRPPTDFFPPYRA